MATLRLPALKPSHMKSLVSPANEAAVIWISDDSSDDSSDNGSEPGTEDCSGDDMGVDVDDVRVNSPRGSDAIRDDARDHDADRGVGHDSDDKGHNDFARQEGDAHGDYNSQTHENSSDGGNKTDTGDIDSTVRAGSSCGKRDGYDTGSTTARADVSVQDWGIYDGPYSDQEDGDAGNYDTATDEPLVLHQGEDIETHVGAIENGNNANSQKGVITAIASIRFWLDQLEAELTSRGDQLQAELTPRGKRKRTFSAPPPAKRRKGSRRVNIMATRVCVRSDSDADVWEYSWQRSRHGRCWVRDLGTGEREEVDGAYLLCYGSSISIDIRANADWLPITVRWNEEKQVFQGLESIGSGILTVEETVMLDVMSGTEGKHFGVFLQGRSNRDYRR